MARLCEVYGVNSGALVKKYEFLAMSRYIIANPITMICVADAYPKILLREKIEFAEVQFYFLHFTAHDTDEIPVPYAVVSIYSRPIQSILDSSFNTLWACSYMGVAGIQVIELSSIISCVSMQPLPRLPEDPESLWFVLEKSGLEDLQLTGAEESIENA